MNSMMTMTMGIAGTAQIGQRDMSNGRAGLWDRGEASGVPNKEGEQG